MMRSRCMRCAIFLTAVFCAPRGFSANLYLETGAGLSWLLGSTTPDFGVAFNGVAGATLNSANAPVQIHAGLALRYLSGRSSTGETLGYLMPIPLIRVEFPIFYVSAGATYGSFVTEAQDRYFSTNLSFDSGLIPIFGEVGFLWRTTPFFHIAFTTSVTYGMGASEFASPFALDAGIQFRFLILGELPGSREAKARDERAKKMRGWRYPYGIAK